MVSVSKGKIDNTNKYKSKSDLLIPSKVCDAGENPHDKTQNASESFNGMVWNRVPKATYVGLYVLSAGVYDAISNFYNGEKSA